jgi:hypothetical protein
MKFALASLIAIMAVMARAAPVPATNGIAVRDSDFDFPDPACYAGGSSPAC